MKMNDQNDADECCTELSKSNLLIAEGELVIT